MRNYRYYGFWILDFLRGGKIRKDYNEIKSLLAKGKIDDWQQEKIKELIAEASTHTQYYSDYTKYKSLEECPVINKQTIKDNFEAIFSDRWKKTECHKMSTSGSTGTPFEILQNPQKRSRVMAELIYFNETAGQFLGDKFVFYRVWTDKNKKTKLGQLKQNLVPVDILHLNDENMKYIADMLLKDKKINSTLAYASTYDAILHYMKKTGITGKFYLKSMISNSEVLADETKAGLEKIIGCKVVNRYSNQECGIIAQSSLERNEMKINGASYYVEILDMEKDEPVKKGECGRIVVTDLFNYAMPLIRYDTGDVGTIADCEEYAFATIGGRRVDTIYDTKGSPLTAHTWSVYMWKYDKLRQYQFIQEDKKKYILKVNGAEGIYEKSDFDETLRGILGDDAEITIEFVDEIPILASGKFKKTVCNYKPDLTK